MDKKIGAKILGTGSYFPKKVLTNADLEKIVDTTDEWIVSRTGMHERRVAAENEVTSDLALGASLEAIKAANIPAEEIELIIVATVTPDMFFPSTACRLQHKLGLSKFNVPAFDLSAACSGFVYAVSIAKAYIESGMFKTILLVGAEILTRITDWTDRNTCVLFGDGAGAMVLTASKKDDGVLSVSLGADGSYGDLLYMSGGGSACPASIESVNAKKHTMKMDGKNVFRNAVPKMVEAAEKAILQSGHTIEEITLFIPHQANIRIIEAVAKKLNIPMDKIFLNIHKTGNISSATTITALDEAIKTGKLKKGDLVVLVAFGGGFTWAGSVIRI